MLGPGLFHGVSSALPQAPLPSSESRATGTAVELMEYDIERLLMITEALWGLLKEQHGYTDADLIQRVASIDARDGRIDGRVAASPPRPCPHCGRIVERKRPRCLYCGHMVPMDPFAR